MDYKELEIMKAEEAIMANFSPVARGFIMNSRKINAYVVKVESTLMELMDDNGLVDWKALNDILEKKYPQLLEWVALPNRKFRLSQEINSILTILGGIYA